MVKPQDFDSSTYFKVRVKNNLGTVFYSSMFTRASVSTVGSTSRHHHHHQQQQQQQQQRRYRQQQQHHRLALILGITQQKY